MLLLLKRGAQPYEDKRRACPAYSLYLACSEELLNRVPVCDVFTFNLMKTSTCTSRREKLQCLRLRQSQHKRRHSSAARRILCVPDRDGGPESSCHGGTACWGPFYWPFRSSVWYRDHLSVRLSIDPLCGTEIICLLGCRLIL